MHMYIYYENITLLMLYHSDMFWASKGHLQGVRSIYFSRKVNKMIY